MIKKKKLPSTMMNYILLNMKKTTTASCNYCTKYTDIPHGHVIRK